MTLFTKKQPVILIESLYIADKVAGKKQLQYPVFLKPIELNFKGGKIDSWNNLLKHTFPEVIRIEFLYDYGKYFQMTYQGMSGRINVNIPKEFEFTSCTEEEIKNANAEFLIAAKKDLAKHLGGSITVGTDPEIFVADENDVVIPAFDFLGSKTSKTTRGRMGYTGGNLPLYWDGFQAEFETAATGCLSYLVDSVFCGLAGLYNYAKAYNAKAKLSLRTVMDIPAEMLAKAKEEHVQFGCMPSLNAYGLAADKRDGRDVTFRPAGGHLHFGIGKTTEEKAIPIIKALDAIIGVASVALFANIDDPKRRTLYGLPGEYRLPPHGIEYRTLSNAWLCHPLIMNWTFDLSRKVVLMAQRDLFEKLWDGTAEETVECITKCDVLKAKEILTRNKLVFLQLCYAAYGYDKDVEKIFNAYLNGVETIVENPQDICSNWMLDKGNAWLGHNECINKNYKTADAALRKGQKVA